MNISLTQLLLCGRDLTVHQNKLQNDNLAVTCLKRFQTNWVCYNFSYLCKSKPKYNTSSFKPNLNRLDKNNNAFLCLYNIKCLMKPGKNLWDIHISSNVSSKMRSYISLMKHGQSGIEASVLISLKANFCLSCFGLHFF